MPRTLVKTSTTGWYIDATDPDGSRVRRRDGDNVITLDEFRRERIIPKDEDASGNGSSRTDSQERAAHAARASNERKRNRDLKDKAVAQALPTTVAETGKVLRGKTTVIKCRWKGTDGKKGPVCGRERVVKVQDAFQVKYCVEHQAAHRRVVKRAKLKAKRRERQKTVA